MGTLSLVRFASPPAHTSGLCQQPPLPQPYQHPEVPGAGFAYRRSSLQYTMSSSTNTNTTSKTGGGGSFHSRNSTSLSLSSSAATRRSSRDDPSVVWVWNNIKLRDKMRRKSTSNILYGAVAAAAAQTPTGWTHGLRCSTLHTSTSYT